MEKSEYIKNFLKEVPSDIGRCQTNGLGFCRWRSINNKYN